MSWIEKLKPPRFSWGQEDKKEGFPEGLWQKCPSCAEIMFKEDLAKNFMVCPNCTYHFRVSARERLGYILDTQSFEELDAQMSPKDPLDFKDLKRYRERIRLLDAKPGAEREAFIYGRGKISGLDVAVGSFVFEYMGGSMGSVVGEKLTRTCELAINEHKPCLIITCSGGARMQEGILSLMQMAKVSAAIRRMRTRGVPLVVLLTDPTTGGVAASVGMLGDVLLAEPKALIGFAGPRVIEQTIKQTLPEGFQTAEFLLEHGMLDRIVTRQQMKETLYHLLSKLGHQLRLSQGG